MTTFRHQKCIDIFDLMEPALDNSQLPLANVAMKILNVTRVNEGMI